LLQLSDYSDRRGAATPRGFAAHQNAHRYLDRQGQSLRRHRLTTTAAPPVYLQARGLSKSFGHVRALQDVDLDIRQAEVLAIVGDNGAGKSTLTKILSGVYQPDRGDIQVNGRAVRITNPHEARELGIATVFQNLALVDSRDVAANL